MLVILSLTIIVNGREVGQKLGDPKLLEDVDNVAPVSREPSVPREPAVPQPISNQNAMTNGNCLSFPHNYDHFNFLKFFQEFQDV